MLAGISEHEADRKKCHEADRHELFVVPPVLPPEPVPGEGVLVAVGINEGGHVPVNRLHTGQPTVAATRELMSLFCILEAWLF